MRGRRHRSRDLERQGTQSIQYAGPHSQGDTFIRLSFDCFLAPQSPHVTRGGSHRLLVPLLHRAETLTLKDIAARREDLVARPQTGKLRPAHIQAGGFTIINLGMYGVDAFNAIVKPPRPRSSPSAASRTA